MQRQRMHAHDYSRVGFYMITMVAASRRPLFGECRDGQVVLSPEGEVVHRRWQEISLHRPEIEASTMQMMPDHLHGILYVQEIMEKPLGNVIRGFASGVTSELRKATGDSALNVWEKGFHDRVIMNSSTLRAERNYIRDNPRRYCLRKDKPDLFVRVNELKSDCLPAGEKWAGFGNLFLIEKPDLMPVQVSRRASPKDLLELKAQVAARTAGGAVIVSPFISAGEKTIAKMVMEQEFGSLILLRPEGFPPIYKPSGAYFDLCARGRLLVLTAFPYNGRKQTLTRDQCLQMNRWVNEICGSGSGNL